MSAAARRYKRPESVLVVVYTRAGEVLMLRRREPSGFWQSVTGSLHWDETPAEAARRELREETGLGAEGLEDCGRRNRYPIVAPWRRRYAPEAVENLEHVFRLGLERACEIVLNPDEHVEYAWMPKAEALRRAGSYTNREAIEAYVPEGPEQQRS